jgi:hypothetical protein
MEAQFQVLVLVVLFILLSLVNTGRRPKEFYHVRGGKISLYQYGASTFATMGCASDERPEKTVKLTVYPDRTGWIDLRKRTEFHCIPDSMLTLASEYLETKPWRRILLAHRNGGIAPVDSNGVKFETFAVPDIRCVTDDVVVIHKSTDEIVVTERLDHFLERLVRGDPDRPRVDTLNGVRLHHCDLIRDGNGVTRIHAYESNDGNYHIYSLDTLGATEQIYLTGACCSCEKPLGRGSPVTRLSACGHAFHNNCLVRYSECTKCHS